MLMIHGKITGVMNANAETQQEEVYLNCMGIYVILEWFEWAKICLFKKIRRVKSWIKTNKENLFFGSRQPCF